MPNFLAPYWPNSLIISDHHKKQTAPNKVYLFVQILWIISCVISPESIKSKINKLGSLKYSANSTQKINKEETKL